MLKKKPIKKPAKHDFTALDAAVDELSKQTEALLGKTGDKAAKPALPKKRSIPHRKGHSFDIVKAPKQPTSLKSTLKTASVSPRQKTTQQATAETPVLLPDHATKSFNEIDVIDTPKPEKISVNVSKLEAESPVIQRHEGTLATPVPEEDTVATAGTTPETLDSNTETTQPTVSHTAISFEEANQKVEPEVSGPKSPVEPTENLALPQTGKEERVKPLQEPESEEDTDETEAAPVEPPAYNSGELFANNLVKDTKPKGYSPEEGQQKPTVFDTNEYHPELHDWSKLEHKGRATWLIFLLLLCVAVGLAYLILSGQALPFL